MKKILNQISKISLMADVEDELKKKGVSVIEGTDNLTAKILLIWCLFNRRNKIVWVVKNQNQGKEVYEWLTKIVRNQVYLVSILDNERENIISNTEILENLKASKPWIMIGSIRALTQKIFGNEVDALRLSRDQVLDLNKLIVWLEKSGFERQERVILPGDYAVRGGIVDIVEQNTNRGFRIETYGNRIESIYQLEIRNQHLTKKIGQISLYPILGKKTISWLSRLGRETIFILDEPGELKQEIDALAYLDLAPNWNKFLKMVSGKKLFFSHLPGLSGGDTHLISWHRSPVRRDKISGFTQYLKTCQNEVIIITDYKDAIARNFSSSEICERIFPESLVIPEIKLEIITDREIFGEISIVSRKRISKKEREFVESLEKGDILVHQNYGLGRFLGRIKLRLFNKEQDYLLLEYAEGDRLFVPFHQISFLTKYIGILGYAPKLSKLGTTSWRRLRKKAEESTLRLARELIQTESLRKRVRGFSFKLDKEWEKALTSSFRYEETSDQIDAIKSVYKDMEILQPMDRLICGDVGFGKTEVAVRAALRAVASGKQVAILAPTTILAEQHLATFSERLNNFPVRIESLSRFKSRKEQRVIVEEITNGKIDIVVGTHRLLQPAIAFSDLGLVIVDEEQRFGVEQKEKLKRLRAQVDILTLSATPIPRTLFICLGGLRDISKIETPPQGRLPIETKILKFDANKIKKAINFELGRKGQVYFIHNRIHSIYTVANKIKTLIPSARIAIAHGRMDEKDLARIMRLFSAGKFDILVATSIVENGLDLPNVNTIIIDRADRFGLAELYHLRGRVGRGLRQAHAYLLIGNIYIDKEARKRLGALLDASDPGSGYNIALQDLEIRGGGNILGREQHGHMVSVGLNLYSLLLEQSVDKIKNISGGNSGLDRPVCRQAGIGGRRPPWKEKKSPEVH